jgi:integrase
VVPCRVICDWRSWPAGGRGCRGSQDQAASEWPRRPRTAPRAARKDVRGLDRFGSAEDGRLFRTSKGAAFTSSAYYRVWRVARSYAFTPEQLASPLAGRPYDLRHAAVSLWLNPGVPAQEVADRVGHSVDVLWKVYAGTIDGDEARLNRMIELALAAFSW